MKTKNKVTSIKFNNISFKISSLDCTKEENDILLTWINPDFKTGPEYSYDIMLAIGQANRFQVYILKEHLHSSDSFIINPGQIPTEAIIFSVLPIDNKSLFNESFFKIKESLNKYKEEFNCRYLGMWFPSTDYNLYIDNLFNYILMVDSLKEITIYCEEKEKDKIYSLLEKEVFKRRTKTFKDKIYYFFNKLFQTR